jgi:hypothetical protein
LRTPEALITYVDVDEQDRGEDTIHLAGRARARQELPNLGEKSIDLTDPGDVIRARKLDEFGSRDLLSQVALVPKLPLVSHCCSSNGT